MAESRYHDGNFSEENAKVLEQEVLSSGVLGKFFGTDSQKATQSMVFILSLTLVIVTSVMGLIGGSYTKDFIGFSGFLLGFFVGKKFSS
jgi:hypothetical protein